MKPIDAVEGTLAAGESKSRQRGCSQPASLSRFRSAGEASGSPAAGSQTVHQQEQEELLGETFADIPA